MLIIILPLQYIKILNKVAYMTFQEMLHRIAIQQELRGIVPQKMTEEQKIKYASECAHALLVEAAELSSSWAFASWKTTQTDKDNIEREIIDCIFFLSNIAACFGISHADLLAKFEWVLKNNYARINNGTHKIVNTCPDCGTPECGHSEAVKAGQL